MSKSGLQCFICDENLTNLCFNVSKCRLQTSKKTLVTLLGKLLGENFYVVCNEDDVICQNCFKLFNQFDNLDADCESVKQTILRLLEKKLGLRDGTLEFQVSSQVPQSASFEEIKQKCQEEMAELIEMEDARSRVGLQCDNCSYTTNYMAFVRRHVRNGNCLHCDAPLSYGRCSVYCAASIRAKSKFKYDQNETEGEKLREGNTVTLFNGVNSDDSLFVDESDCMGDNIDGELSLPEEETAVALSGKKAVYLQVVENGTKDIARQLVAVRAEAGGVEGLQVFWEDDLSEAPVDSYM